MLATYNVTETFATDHLFRLLDAEGVGHVDLMQLVVLVGQLRCDIDRVVAETLYRIYDTRRNGEVAAKDIASM
eukprot:1024295-Prorocentrum_minimum.AAC.1